MLKKLTLLHLYITILVLILFFHTFFPDSVNVDRYTITILVILFFISILPTLASGKVSYLFEFKRDLQRAVKQWRGIKKDKKQEKQP